MNLTFSFDDNNKLNLKLADLFTEFGFTATFFLMPTNSIEEIKYLHQNGFEIGSHSLIHVNLTEISDSWAYKEVNASKQRLEEILKKSVYGFCYPNGKFNSNVVSVVEMAGYKYARTVGEGSIKFSPKNPYTIVPTLQIYNSLSRRYIRLKGRMRFTTTGDWEKACLIFLKNVEDGVIHIWGHSWEIEKQNQWKKLEKLLEYLQKSNIKPVTNYEAYCEKI